MVGRQTGTKPVTFWCVDKMFMQVENKVLLLSTAIQTFQNAAGKTREVFLVGMTELIIRIHRGKEQVETWVGRGWWVLWQDWTCEGHYQ